MTPRILLINNIKRCYNKSSIRKGWKLRMEIIQKLIDAVRGKKCASRKECFGEFSYCSQDFHIGSSETKIGKFCSIAPGVTIGPSTHPTNFLSTHPFQYLPLDCLPEGGQSLKKTEVKRVEYDFCKPVIIENDVWIGINAVIMDGVKVSNGAIVAAGAIVTKDVPPYAIVGGVPAKIIKYRFPQEIINELLELKWWDMPVETIAKLPFNDIVKCIEILKADNSKMLK